MSSSSLNLFRSIFLSPGQEHLMPIVYYQTDINSIIFQLPLIYLMFMFDSIDEIKIMTEPDSETKYQHVYCSIDI